MRAEKEHLHTEVLHLIKSLKKIHAEIPLESIKPLPVIPTLNINIEFPERKIMVRIPIHKIKITLHQNYNFLLNNVTVMYMCYIIE